MTNLEKYNLLDTEERKGASKVLVAAALTYVAGLVTTLLELTISSSANQNIQFIQSSLQSLETDTKDDNELFIIRSHLIRELIHCKG